jgi:membrane protein insertase Oxa1/YidC/SpoIIIJ
VGFKLNNYIVILGSYLPAFVGPIVALVAIYLLRHKVKLNKWLQALAVVIVSIVLFFVVVRSRFLISASFSGEGDDYHETLSPEIFALILLPIFLLLSFLLIYLSNLQSLPNFSSLNKKWKISFYALIIGIFGFPIAFDLFEQSYHAVSLQVDMQASQQSCLRQCEDMAKDQLLKAGMDAVTCKAELCK